MIADEIWSLPGPRRFLIGVVEHSFAGSSVVVFAPNYLAPTLVVQIRAELRTRERRVDTLDGESDPVVALASSVEANDGILSIFDQVARSGSRTLVIHVNSKPHLEAWWAVARRFQHHALKLEALSRPTLVIVSSAASSSCTEEVALKICYWKLAWGEIDSLALGDNFLFKYGRQTPIERIVTHTIARLALWDAELAKILSDRRVEVIKNPVGLLIRQLYVRTTKRELGLSDPKRKFYQVAMAPGQLALYGIVRNESLRQIVQAVGSTNSGVDFIGAKRSVMRLLQLSSNPVLALKAIAGEVAGLKSGVIDQVLAEGPSTKMRAVADHARSLAHAGQKVVIWTIFTDTICELERMLADLNPVTLFGAVPAGEPSDFDTREGRLRRFHVDKACQVMIANPAAAGEGISLHTVCHHAIYLDRSYVSTHYLQSVDRIHRLGLPSGVETYIHIYQTKAPAGLGSVDMSVSRRLAAKLRNLQRLLDDADLHQIALDEENADDPVDYDVELQDLIDLVAELEGKKDSIDEDAE